MKRLAVLLLLTAAACTTDQTNTPAMLSCVTAPAAQCSDAPAGHVNAFVCDDDGSSADCVTSDGSDGDVLWCCLAGTAPEVRS